MKPWLYTSLGDAIMAAGSSDRIREAFLSAFESAGRPAEMAVFTRTDSQDRLHCEVSAHFSPASAEVAKTFQANPCEQPFRTGLTLLAGDQGSWLVLFPRTEAA